MSAPNQQSNSTPNSQPNPAPGAQTNAVPNPQWRIPHDGAAILRDLTVSGLQAYAYPSRHRANIPHSDTHINEEGVRVNAEGIRVVPSLAFNEVPIAVQATLLPIGGNTVQFQAPVRSNLIARDQHRIDLERANQLVNIIINNAAQGRHPFQGIASSMQLSIDRTLISPHSPHNIDLSCISVDPNGISAMHEPAEPAPGQMPLPYIPRPPAPAEPDRPQTPFYQPRPEAPAQPFRPPSPFCPNRFPINDNSTSSLALNNPAP